MSIADTSWISEPHIHDLLMQFPLPLAVLDRDGNIGLINKHFTGSFDVSCLKSDSLRKILLIPDNLTQTITLLQSNDCQTEVHARTVNIGDSVILVLEESAETAFSKELFELHQRISDLEKLSATDRLTGAWNRTHFDKTVTIEISRSVRYGQPLALIFFDIDHFKQVNDTFGHAVGDEVLRELVKVVSMNIRASDMLFRWGGEEFVILAPSTSYRSAANLAETLRTRIEQHKIATVGNITISLGVAEHLADENEHAFLKRADKVLYAAKNGGRNRVEVEARGNSDAWAAEQDQMILHLSWHESYECGEPTIDREHLKLFELANALIDAAFTRGTNPVHFNDALDKLLAHIAHHFEDEETIMAQHHYAELDEHAAAHRKLVERALKLRVTAAAGGVTVGELVGFLADEVVAKHMLQVDRKFYPLFRKTFPSKQADPV